MYWWLAAIIDEDTAAAAAAAANMNGTNSDLILAGYGYGYWPLGIDIFQGIGHAILPQMLLMVTCVAGSTLYSYKSILWKFISTKRTTPQICGGVAR